MENKTTSQAVEGSTRVETEHLSRIRLIIKGTREFFGEMVEIILNGDPAKAVGESANHF